jgi:hypothetical protein
VSMTRTPPPHHHQQQQQAMVARLAGLAQSPAPLPPLPYQDIFQALDLPWRLQRRTVVQSCCLVRPPPVLLLQLQRMGNAKGGLYKMSNHVRFPLVLDLMPHVGLMGELGIGVGGSTLRSSRSRSSVMSGEEKASGVEASNGGGTSCGTPDCDGAKGGADPVSCSYGKAAGGRGGCSSSSSKQQQLLYDLVAVGQHIGGFNAGHYLLYRRLWPSKARQGVLETPAAGRVAAVASPCSNTPCCAAKGPAGSVALCGCGSEGCWVRVSDANVSPARVEEVLQCQATLLVYEQRR